MRKLPLLLLIALFFASVIAAGAQQTSRVYLPLLAGGSGAPAPLPPGSRAVNAPFFDVADVDTKFSELAVFWFGKVRPDTNYSDVRVGYNSRELYVYVATIDRRLWYPDPPAVAASADLTQWDAVELLIDTGGADGAAPRPSSYRLLAGFSGAPDGAVRKSYERAFRGDGSAWAPAAVSFTTRSGWRGEQLNDDRDDKGWAMAFRVPFSSLGVSPPANGARWALSVRAHDRDTGSGAVLPVVMWPEQARLGAPSSWGSVRFGIPAYSAPAARNAGQVTIRQGLAGVTTPDGAVGGGTVCGGSLDYWTQWGEKTYFMLEDDPNSERGDFNVQNQSDISDWPCFSKYYITFPLTTLPKGKVIVSAKLVLHNYGGSGADKTKVLPSLIQVLTVGESWDEPTLSWNNAPLATENFGGAWVAQPLQSVSFPGVPHDFDVSIPLAQAYAAGAPLRLAVYSADSAYDSGKHFISADTGDWNAVGRPTLLVTIGDPAP